MPIASGVFKQLSYKQEATWGTVPAASAAQALRRISSSLDLSKETYQSNEIRTDLQLNDFRHGVRSVAGKVTGDLSAGTWKDFMAAILKRDYASVTAIASLSITIAGSGPTYTVTRASGSWLTDGLKVGDVFRLTGGFNAANSAKNLFVVTLTATIATVIVLNGSALVAEGPIASATATVVGKKTFVPTTGHLDRSFSIEHWFPEAPASEVFTGCKPSACAISLPPTGIATIDWDFMGRDVTTSATQYFTSPTAASTTGSLASVNGVVRVGSTTVATITGLTLNIAANFTGDAVVGSNVKPVMTPGRVLVTGQATCYFDDTTFRDVFLNETETSIACAFTSDNTAAADFVSFVLPRVKFGGASKDDGEKGIVQTIPFQALFNSAGGTGTSSERTTLVVQDSQA
jgi:hypothetical protein